MLSEPTEEGQHAVRKNQALLENSESSLFEFQIRSVCLSSLAGPIQNIEPHLQSMFIEWGPQSGYFMIQQSYMRKISQLEMELPTRQ